MNNFLIKTPHGFVPFKTVAKTSKKRVLEIVLANGTIIKSGREHIFFIDDMITYALDLQVGQFLTTEDDVSEILFINEIEIETDMFDVVGVENNDLSFYANNVKTHNCQFLAYEKTLIDTDFLDEYVPMPIISVKNGFEIYEDTLHEDALMLVTIDPSGMGEDSSAIQVWAFEPTRIIQLASFADEHANASEIFEHILWLQVFMKEYWKYDPENAVLIFERNGIGEGLAQILAYTERAQDYLEIPLYYDPRGKPGFHMSDGIKTKVLLQLKQMFENGKLLIGDKEEMAEFYGFVRKGNGSFGGKSGYHDDRIMCTAQAMYYLVFVIDELVSFSSLQIDTLLLDDDETKQKKKEKQEAKAKKDAPKEIKYSGFGPGFDDEDDEDGDLMDEMDKYDIMPMVM